jgi:UDP-N-acetylmuramyl pentapeptide phosphotransferase/UDP-N-acetylglucosamine-1-phosphate transferase
MFEIKKTRGHRSWGISIFGTMPWIVRAYIYLFLIVLLGIFGFGAAEDYFDKPEFGKVADELIGFLKLIVGAVLGALSMRSKLGSGPEKDDMPSDL